MTNTAKISTAKTAELILAQPLRSIQATELRDGEIPD
jgi:hypothetical protein